MGLSSVSIIIPNYNGEEILATNLGFVRRAAASYSAPVETIVVDDASKDGSIALIEKQFPEIRIVTHGTNRGFSEAVHSGVDAARYPIIVLLNSDVRPDSRFLAPLIGWFSRGDTFAVSPLICDPQGNPQRVSWNTPGIIRGEIRNQDWDIERARQLAAGGRPLKSLYASGGSAAIRKEMFIRLGGFLPLYQPFYYEDRDLATRAYQRGWQTYFEPRSRVVHDHHGTIHRFFAGRKIKIVSRRNRFFYLWLHLSRRHLARRHAPWILLRLFTRLLKLDTIYPAALLRALAGMGDVIRLKRELVRQGGFKPLEKIIEDIRGT